MPDFVAPSESGILTPDDVELGDEKTYDVAAFDPGGTTGWALFSVFREAITDPEYRIMENVVCWSAGQFVGTEREQTDQMYDLAMAWPNAKLVCEDFVLRKFSSARELLSPVRMNARFDERMYSSTDSRAIIYQPGNLAMNTVTDERLKKMGLYPPLSGQEHARDAVRHAVTWLKRAKQLVERKMVTDALMKG